MKLRKSMSFKSSSFRQDSASTHHHVKAANVGCMSGIFRLVSKYHTRRKFLTFGRGQEKQVPSSPARGTNPEPEIVTCPSREKESSITPPTDVLRSPAIPAEIRSSNSVARLTDVTTARWAPVTSESAAEKRRKLLGALEKCDEDLKTLKRIIEAVRVSQTPPPQVVVVDVGGLRRDTWREEEDEPSPVSVLEHHHHVLSGSPSLTKRARHGKVQQRQQITKKKPWEEDNASFCLLSTPKNRQVLNMSTIKTTRTTSATPWTWSREMRETVAEVCRDVSFGQRREVGRIVLLLQDFIFRDLVDEITKEMSCCHSYTSLRSLPFEACKRKLCF